MLEVFIYLIAILIFIFIDFGEVFKGRHPKPIIIYSSFMVLSLTVFYLYSIGVPIPSPAEPIKDFVSSIFPVL